MNPEPATAADILRHYVEVGQRVSISDKTAAAMIRELQAFAAVTEEGRATLVHTDQPANFAMVLKTEGTGER